MNNEFQIGKELAELRARIERLERKPRCGCRCGGAKQKGRQQPALTAKDLPKIQEFIRVADGYRRVAEGEDVPNLPVIDGYTPEEIACILGCVVAMCGMCIVVCGGPEDIPCIAECCEEVWEEILEICVG